MLPWMLLLLQVGSCGEVRLILESRIDASPKSTTGQEDRTEERRKPAGPAGCTYLLEDLLQVAARRKRRPINNNNNK